MAEFKRKFDVAALKLVGIPGFFKDLLKSWAPAGTPADIDSGRFLRLAVRNGYLNFYYKGQSVANVGQYRTGELKLNVHQKYVFETPSKDQIYVSMSHLGTELTNGKEEICKYQTAVTLKAWAKKAFCFSGSEKRGVDAILSNPANTHVIDMEMALPAKNPGETAPRMDLVVLDGETIRFWEAKTLNNPELRASGVAEPKVFEQLERYTNWFGNDGNKEKVADAYKKAAEIICQLWELAEITTPKPASFIAASKPETMLKIDTSPLIVCFSGKLGESWQSTPSRWHNHRDKIRDRGTRLIDHDASGNIASDNSTCLIDPAKIHLVAPVM